MMERDEYERNMKYEGEYQPWWKWRRMDLDRSKAMEENEKNGPRPYVHVIITLAVNI